jgi:prepilin-type N-terminal cleavage/methylation domain-containing protein
MNGAPARGFTLVEMLVSIALFAIVMLMVSSAYLIIIAANRQAQALAAATDNLSFALESMTREIRTGTDYNCGTSSGGNCMPNPRSAFYFTDSSGAFTSYGLSGGQIFECSSYDSYCAPSTPITDSAVTITALNFYVQGTKPYNGGNGDTLQPQVLITIAGTAPVSSGKTAPFYIETGATMRGTDL